MKKGILKLGKALNKTQQKAINGGGQAGQPEDDRYGCVEVGPGVGEYRKLGPNEIATC